MTAVKTILATIIVPGLACFLVPYLILSGEGAGFWPRLGFLQLLAIPLALLGAVMVMWVSFSFVRRGMGTPIPIDPPKILVVHGLYLYTRNPMYLGALLILVSECITFRSMGLLVYTVLLWLVLHLFVVLIEEPQLKRRFGDAYLRYLDLVPRWLPRLSRRVDGSARVGR